MSAGAPHGGTRRAFREAAAWSGRRPLGRSRGDPRSVSRSIAKKSIEPIAGLLEDLKSRGLLDETLVVWASEMGRTPFDNNLTTDKPGRDHNQYGLVMWMAGGDVKAGYDVWRDG